MHAFNLIDCNSTLEQQKLAFLRRKTAGLSPNFLATVWTYESAWYNLSIIIIITTLHVRTML